MTTAIHPNSKVIARTEALLEARRTSIHGRTDRLFALLLALQWLGGIAMALWLSPRTWSGDRSEVHVHVWAAVLMGGVVSSFPIMLAVLHPGRPLTRHAIAVTQMLTSGLLIHLSGGRIETHFHVFGSLAFLSFYRDWRVLVTASAVVAVDHFVRGVFWPQSVFGVLTASYWRWLEHVGWVLFEDSFLFASIAQSNAQMRDVAAQQARLENVNEGIEQQITARVSDLEAEIAERRRVEQERDRFFDASLDLMCVCHVDGSFRRVNRAFERTLGWTVEELLDQPFIRLFHPDDRSETMVRVDLLTEGVPVVDFENRCLCKDGSYRWISWTATTVEPNGLFFPCGRDVTERKRSEEELHRSLKELANLQYALDKHSIVGITDSHGAIVYANDKFCELSKYPREELLGQNHRILNSGLHPREFMTNLWQTIARGNVWHGEIRNRAKDGSLYWVNTTIVPILNNVGKPYQYVSIRTDLTQRKTAEEALKESQRFLQSSLDALSAHIAILDETGRIVAVNAAWEQFADANEAKAGFCGIGANYVDVCERAVGECSPAAHAVARGIRELIARERDDFHLEYACHSPTEQRWFMLRVTRFRGDGAVRVVVAHENVTDRKLQEQQTADLQQQLVDASRQAGMAEVATGVLHNVGNVLNSVNVSATVIAEAVTQGSFGHLDNVVAMLREHPEDLGTFLAADSRGKRLLGFMEQLAEHQDSELTSMLQELELLRKNIEHIKDIVAMQQSYAMASGVTERIKMSDLIEDALQINEAALRRHEVTVSREIADLAPVVVDKHKVLQILINLLRNAKYACDEAGRPDKRIAVRLSNGGDRLRVEVSDNGVGIPSENLTRIFNHGFTTRKDGHGFGLHSGALAAKEMGGSLAGHSDGPGLGATFILELPHHPPTTWS